jgi:hypothetical protein
MTLQVKVAGPMPCLLWLNAFATSLGAFVVEAARSIRPIYRYLAPSKAAISLKKEVHR